MVDKADYIFGMSGTSKKDVHHQSFNERIDEVCGESNDEGVLAAKAFLAGWKQEDSVELRDWEKKFVVPMGNGLPFDCRVIRDLFMNDRR